MISENGADRCCSRVQEKLELSHIGFIAPRDLIQTAVSKSSPKPATKELARGSFMTIMHTPGCSGCMNLCVDAAATQFGGLQMPERTLGHGDRSDEWLAITQSSNEKGYRGTPEDFVGQ